MENNWTVKNNKLIREFIFSDYKEALKFVNFIGEIAEKENHHPDIFLSFGKVKIELFTHDTNSITDKDVNLSREIDKIYKRR